MSNQHGMPSPGQETLLKDKIALITGCSGGIGRATALSLARRGASIAVHYNSAEQAAESLVQELRSLSVRAVAFQADLSSYDRVRELHRAVVDGIGHPDILFCNAGISGGIIGPRGNIQDISVEVFEHTWRTNTGAHFLLTQLCLPAMESKEWGRIVFCSSVAASNGGVVGPHYASSKSAMHGLVHWLANRYATRGITANAVAPALITDTGLIQGEPDHFKSNIPIGRLGRPQEIASVVELFVTNAYMTNKIIVADGGWTPSAF